MRHDAELIASIFGARASDPAFVSTYQRLARGPDFPRLNALLGGRHVPSVLAFLERFENAAINTAALTEEEREARWNRSARRRA